MIVNATLGGRRLRFDPARARSIAVPTDPHGDHPRFFGAGPATAEPLRVGAFSGRVSDGASCNAEWLRFAPHCHGTHTEGPGHLAAARMPVQDIAPASPLIARLLSVSPVAPEHTSETPPHPSAGRVIESGGLNLQGRPPAVIVRTLPNGPDKAGRDWDRAPPYPVLSMEALRMLVEASAVHLLIDTPSLDPATDEGRMAAHRAFWDMPDDRAGRPHCTITEMVYVPDELPDGLYLLSLNVSSLIGEAAPSAPVLYPRAR